MTSLGDPMQNRDERVWPPMGRWDRVRWRLQLLREMEEAHAPSALIAWQRVLVVRAILQALGLPRP